MNGDKTPKHETEPRPAAETETYTPNADPSVSDVKLAESVTGAAPTFRPPAPAGGPRVPKPPVRRDQRPPALLPGTEIDDFEIIRMLGRGAFGHVYLARQRSLDREVALKISANRGSEGRTMARLEHAHVVQVYSEKVDAATDQRLLCMQLVPGVGLERIIATLDTGSPPGRGGPAVAGSMLGAQLAIQDQPSNIRQPDRWTGADLLAVIERNASLPAALDPAALRDREALSQMDGVEATAWIGARLAEALDFAHHRGVLHRDIKPANILVSPYGRPMLADFNISSQQVQDEHDDMFGGTIAYMAPEHLDAFNPTDDTPHDAVAEPADIYSLGIVLRELLEGRRAIESPDPLGGGMTNMLRRLADERRQKPPCCCIGPPDARKTLERTICRCLAPNPADRFASGAELAEQLDGCRRMRQAERQLPTATPLVRQVLARPFLWFLVLVLLPQIAGSVLNVSYNLSVVARSLTDVQKKMFMELVMLYNLVAYPVALLIFAWVVLRVRRAWQAMHGTQPLPAGEAAQARRKALRLPLWMAGLTIGGWMPGGVLFPAVIAARTEPLDARTWMHFIVSFTLSGLIALAYSLCGSQFVVQRALYPRLWDDVRQFTTVVRQELAPMAARLSGIQALAGSIPLVAAVLMLVLGGNEMHPAFRWIVTGLIILGLIGYQLAMHVTRSLTDTTVALTGAKG